MDLEKIIRDIPDFPKPGILFKDITTLLKDPTALKESIEQMKQLFADEKIDKVCGIESRGFIFGVPLAIELGCGFVPIRKNGKLPWTKYSQEYSLEYGTDKLEVHVDAIDKGERVLVVDDLLATGGTANAVTQLLNKMEADIRGFSFLIELGFLNGREKLVDQRVEALIKYD
jgi:adenine phosphoribosyltransferase